MEIRTSAHFERQYKKLPQTIKEKAKRQEKLFIDSVFDPRISTHKLHGKDAGKWAYSVDYYFPLWYSSYVMIESIVFNFFLFFVILFVIGGIAEAID